MIWSWVADDLVVGCGVRAARRVGGCGRSTRSRPPRRCCARASCLVVSQRCFGAFAGGLRGPRCATRRGLRSLYALPPSPPLLCPRVLSCGCVPKTFSAYRSCAVVIKPWRGKFSAPKPNKAISTTQFTINNVK